MAGCGSVDRVFGDAAYSSHPFQPFSLSANSSSSILGSSSMVSFEDVCGGKRSERPFFCTFDQSEIGDDDYDEYLHHHEKKRRLSIQQVQFLEKSFETENKLEPERKTQLANELGLQPRQVAIWFQNRRARWKIKQMERDYDKLQANFNSLKSDYQSLLEENEKLKAEVLHLTEKLELKKQGNSEPSNVYDQLIPIPIPIQPDPNIKSPSESDEQNPSRFGYYKQEDLSSAKSDVIDSDSSQYVEPGHSSSFAEHAFDADHSDVSQDDEDYLSNRTVLPTSHVFPKIEDIDTLPVNSSHFCLPGDDHASLFWPYWDTDLKMPSSLYM